MGSSPERAGAAINQERTRRSVRDIAGDGTGESFAVQTDGRACLPARPDGSFPHTDLCAARSFRYGPPALEGIREIGVIWQGELRRALRSPRTLVLVLLYCFFAALVLIAVSFMVSSATSTLNTNLGGQGVPEEGQAQVALEAKAALLKWLFREDVNLVEALSRIPVVIPLVFKITLFFLPAYAALMGFDQISGEIEPRSIRYLAVRARRSSILFGKFAAQATVLVSLILLVDTLIFATARILNPEFEFSLLLPTLLRFWVAAFVFSTAYVALTSLCSALFSLPAVSLIFNLIALFGLWMLDAVGGWIGSWAKLQGQEEPFLANLRWLSPTAYSNALLHPEFAVFGRGLLAYLLFSAVFLAAGYLVLRRRDV